jgi:hypothetical protein
MARDNAGFMSANLGSAQEPVAPNAALLEQAGSYRGKAEEIDGQRTAAAITTVAQVGEAAYKGYVAAEAESTALKVRDAITGNKVDPELEKRYASEFGRIKEAASQGVIDQAHASALLGAEMRRLIAQHPGQSDIIRKEYQTATGASNWDVRLFYEAMTAERKKGEANKLADATNKLVFDAALGMGKTPTEAQAIVSLPSTDPIRRSVEEAAANSAKLAQTRTNLDNTGQIDSRNSDTYANTLKTYTLDAVTKKTGELRMQLSEFVKTSGIDLGNPSKITKEQLSALVAKKDAILLEIDTVYESQMQVAKQWAAARPSFTKLDDVHTFIATQRENTMKLFDSMTDKALLLPSLKTFADLNNKNMAASLSQVQAMSQLHSFVRSVASPDLLDAASDPNKREALRKSNSGNAYIDNLVKYADAMQNGSMSLANSLMPQLTKYNQIGEAMTNPAASPAAVAAAQNSTPEERKDVAKVLFSSVSPILRDGKASPEDVPKVVAATKIWSGKGNDLATMRDAVTTGKLFSAVGPENKEAVTNNVLAVSDSHMRPTSRLVTELRDSLTRVTRGGTFSMQVVWKDGVLQLADASGAAVGGVTRGPSFSMQSASAQALINDANRLLDIQKSLGVNVDQRAAMFINDVKGVARPKPAAAPTTPPSTPAVSTGSVGTQLQSFLGTAGAK